MEANQPDPEAPLPIVEREDKQDQDDNQQQPEQTSQTSSSKKIAFPRWPWLLVFGTVLLGLAVVTAVVLRQAESNKFEQEVRACV